MSVGAKPACAHEHVIEHAYIDGTVWKRCQVCGKNWLPLASQIAKAKSDALCPPYYERQRVGWNYWQAEKWGKLAPKNFYDAENLVKQWNAAAEVEGIPARYRLPLHCNKCYHVCSETFGPGGECSKCHAEAWNLKPKPIVAVRTKGEIWKIDSSLSPMGTTQWGYMGSAKNPYVITRYKTKRDGSTTVDGWACGCMDFTRRVPRTPCKHILNVMAGEGVVPANVAKANAGTMKALANVNDEQLEAFKKWQREQAEAADKKPEAGDPSLNLFGNTGRKFR